MARELDSDRTLDQEKLAPTRLVARFRAPDSHQAPEPSSAIARNGLRTTYQMSVLASTDAGRVPRSAIFWPRSTE